MTTQQEEIYRYIVKFKRENDGNSPGIRSIANAYGISHKTMWRRIQAMMQAGLLTVQATGGQERIHLGGEWHPPQWWKEIEDAEAQEAGDIQGPDRPQDQTG